MHFEMIPDKSDLEEMWGGSIKFLEKVHNSSCCVWEAELLGNTSKGPAVGQDCCSSLAATIRVATGKGNFGQLCLRLRSGRISATCVNIHGCSSMTEIYDRAQRWFEAFGARQSEIISVRNVSVIKGVGLRPISGSLKQ